MVKSAKRSAKDGEGNLAKWSAFGMPLVVVAAVLLRLALVSNDQFACRSDLIFESPNLATVQQIQAGLPIYHRGVFNDTPFVLTMYTPLYHGLVALLPTPTDHPFLAGRIVAALAMLVAAGLLLLPGRPTRIWLLPVLAFGAFFCFRGVVSNTAFMRHDPLGLLFSVGAVLAIAKPASTGRMAVLSGVLSAAAFLVKQSFLTSGAACLLFLVLQDRRLAAVFLVGWLAPVLAAAVGLVAWCSAEGVAFSWFVAPRGPLNLNEFWLNARTMLRQPVFVLLLALVAATGLTAARRTDLVLWRESPFPIFLVVSGLATAVMSAKVGSATNAYFEFTLAQLMWLLYYFRHVTWSDLPRPKFLSALLGISLVMALELSLATRSEYSFVDNRPLQIPGTSQFVTIQQLKADRIARSRQELSHLKGETRQLLNLTAEVWMTSSLAEQICFNDPLAYSLQWSQGTLSAESLVAAIARRDFDVILLPTSDTPASAIPWFHQSDGWQSVVSAAERHYRMEYEGIYRYLVPR